MKLSAKENNLSTCMNCGSDRLSLLEHPDKFPGIPFTSNFFNLFCSDCGNAIGEVETIKEAFSLWEGKNRIS